MELRHLRYFIAVAELRSVRATSEQLHVMQPAISRQIQDFEEVVGAAMFEGSRNEGVAFVLDLSKQKRSEEAFQKAQTALAHVARVATMGELTASIAHEINQPLGAIANNAQAGLRFLATGSENLQDVKEALSDILKGAERLNGIIVRMRALAKKTPPEMVQLNFKDVVGDVLSCIHHELTRRHVEIEFDLSRELPAVLADRVQLQQVLLNLVINAYESGEGTLNRGQ